MPRYLLSLSVTALLLTGCAGDYAINSNLSRDNFEQYFAPSQVALLSADTPIGNATVLGLVEGISCQSDNRDVPANDADARTDMRLQAGKLGADAVRLHQCLALEEQPGCVAARACYGQAIKQGNVDE
ncbi:lipoprotein, putative [Ferrimonas balearica DSM 9799]|uniref:Lipoprotein, putative n=1 Tax=Ferrimonas balearica (strain DSM 9799 / CCM 4581 / KCTC 23876 / PAT) TaxID=550540 RepID=E1SU38_FERBD|nr:Rcs stress response system protein RcsF [Ferrimonas balearica]ADN75185.1 lipoprotein, putative [Ferrimonas balearica DSM 9799]MBY5978848.1 hypothetical protein [Ferrimonas balearica]MBY6105159.1 hypothetical protein [Ferrimonas balearica]